MSMIKRTPIEDEYYSREPTVLKNRGGLKKKSYAQENQNRIGREYHGHHRQN